MCESHYTMLYWLYLLLYNALIRPLFDFADTIRGDRDNITLMHDLQVLQNKAAKVILDLPNYASSTDALKTLGWPTLFQERLVHRYITTFKYIHGLVDHNFNILRNSDIHSCNTRRRNDFRLPLAKRITESRDFLINALRNGTFQTHLWNNIIYFGYFIAFNILIYLTF